METSTLNLSAGNNRGRDLAIIRREENDECTDTKRGGGPERINSIGSNLRGLGERSESTKKGRLEKGKSIGEGE